MQTRDSRPKRLKYHANCIIKFQNPANNLKIRDFSCTKLNYSRPELFKFHAIACLSAQTLHILYKQEISAAKRFKVQILKFFSSVLSFFSSVESRGEPFFSSSQKFFSSVYPFDPLIGGVPIFNSVSLLVKDLFEGKPHKQPWFMFDWVPKKISIS